MYGIELSYGKGGAKGWLVSTIISQVLCKLFAVVAIFEWHNQQFIMAVLWARSMGFRRRAREGRYVNPFGSRCVIMIRSMIPLFIKYFEKSSRRFDNLDSII